MNYFSMRYMSYAFGYELLMINGLLTFIGMWLFRIRDDEEIKLLNPHPIEIKK